MLTFLYHKGNEIGALTTFKHTNAVNGERSLSGTVHGNLEIEKGWGVRFEDEYYKVIYAKPKSLGKINIVQFDAVHQFFWDFDKSSVYSELDGSYPFQTFLDHVFNGSGYRYNLEVEVGSLRKQNFGLKKRLELFNDLIKHAGVEFQVRGKVVRILERTGTDLSTVVRKKLNLNDLSIEKRIGDFITYQRGLGAWYDENDHSKGRLEVEYVSPLAAIYGRLEGEPYVDERFTIAENFLEVLKKSVEDSYSISIQLTMEDLHKAGYRYTRPLAGDYITVIDEDINFKERVRIVSFETEYDIKGQVIDHAVTCNDIGSVKKQSVGYSSLKSSVANVSKETENALQTANKALVSADGKSTVYFGTEFPQDVPKGTLTKGDTLYLKVGDKTKMYYWNGAEWLEPPVVNDVEAFKESINTEIDAVNSSIQAQSEEHDRQVADILSKTQSVEALANKAKSDAASAIARANQVKTEAVADAQAQVATVSQALNTAKTELQTAIASADQKARDSQASATALRNDLNLQAAKILEQAQAQTALTNRVTTVETLADGTRSTVTELSKTVNKATGDIASVTSRTKTVEDTLTQTRTQYEALTQTVDAQTGQIDSISRRTGTIETGLAGVQERFENLQVGGENLLLGTNESSEIFNSAQSNAEFLKTPYDLALVFDKYGLIEYTLSFDLRATKAGTVRVYQQNGSGSKYNGPNFFAQATTEWKRFEVTFTPTAGMMNLVNSYLAFYGIYGTGIIPYVRRVKLEKGNIATDWSPSGEDLRHEIATYKRTAEESSAELSRQIQLADGKAVEAKTYAQQTADGLKTRLESLETYKDGESTRASQYLTASRTETAKQLTAERTVIATNYVAKSTYTEDVRGTTQKLNEIKSTADTAKQNLATYQNTVDRKLEELTSSTQTLDGKINTASAKVDTVAGQIRTEISEVEGKIPSEVGGRNYVLKSQAEISSTGRWVNKAFNLSSNSLSNLSKIKTITISCDVEGSNVTAINNRKRYGLAWSVEINGIVNYWEVWQTGDTAKKRISQTFTVPDGKVITKLYSPTLWIQAGGDIKVSNPKIEFGRVPTDHTLAPEDFNDELSAVKTTINQTSQGVEQLSTSLSTTNDKVSTAETKIRQLINDVSSKVSQTDYNTLTGRVSSAETAITQNAQEISRRLTSTQVESAITGKGYQTKSQVDDNITGRGYITSSALQPYALSTTVQNLVKETSDSFSRTISQVENKIPTELGSRNYILNSRTVFVATNNGNICPKSVEKLKEGNREYLRIRRTNPTLNPQLFSIYSEINKFSSEMPTSGKGKISFKARASTAVKMNVMGIIISGTETNLPWDRTQISIGTEWKTYSFDFEFVKGMTILRVNPLQILPPVPNLAEFYLDLCEWQLEAGSMTSSWSLATEDLATVTALHDVKDTVTSHTRTISTINGTVSTLVQTANGLVTEVTGTNGLKTQVSQLKNSWAVQLSGPAGLKTAINASDDGIRLLGRNIRIDGNALIDNAVITSAMIAGLDAGKINTGELNAARIKANSIDGSKIVFDQAFLNKMTANEAYLQQLFAKDAFLTAVQAVSISASQITGGLMRATNGAMEINLNAGQMLYYTDNAALKRVLSGYPTQFVKFATGYVANKGNAGVTVIGSNRWNSESANDGGFVGIRAWNGPDIDLLDLVGDRIRLASSPFENADGWSINTLPGKLEIDAHKASDRPSSRMSVGDVNLYRSGTSYISLKDVLQQFNTNFKHLQNITGRGDVILTWDTIK